jgi:predicted nuclease with TOPRIM domain
MQALDTSTTRLSAVVERLHGVETECKQLASMFRTLETEVPSIADMRAFASKAELAEKANIVDVNEVRVASVDVLLACCISQFQRCSCS